MADLRDTLLMMAREKLSTKDMLMVLTSTPVEELLLADPSIRNNCQQSRAELSCAKFRLISSLNLNKESTCFEM